LYSNTGDGTLLFVEQWESIEILGAHLKTEHFLKFGENIADLVAEDLIIDVFNAEAVDL
jgi:quinol monooxygenase YgiN